MLAPIETLILLCWQWIQSGVFKPQPTRHERPSETENKHWNLCSQATKNESFGRKPEHSSNSWNVVSHSDLHLVAVLRGFLMIVSKEIKVKFSSPPAHDGQNKSDWFLETGNTNTQGTWQHGACNWRQVTCFDTARVIFGSDMSSDVFFFFFFTVRTVKKSELADDLCGGEQCWLPALVFEISLVRVNSDHASEIFHLNCHHQTLGQRQCLVQISLGVLLKCGFCIFFFFFECSV